MAWNPVKRVLAPDALIVRASSDGGCERLLPEDPTHGRVIAGVGIDNPFVPQAV